MVNLTFNVHWESNLSTEIYKEKLVTAGSWMTCFT